MNSTLNIMKIYANASTLGTYLYPNITWLKIYQELGPSYYWKIY